MRYGILLPPFGPCADLTVLTGLAIEPEAADWDGFFLWDDITSSDPMPIAALDHYGCHRRAHAHVAPRRDGHAERRANEITPLITAVPSPR